MTPGQPTSRRPRFPWIQLVFCLACLSTAAWTWMRYSYCWECSLAFLNSPKASDLDGLYVRVRGNPVVLGNLPRSRGERPWQVELYGPGSPAASHLAVLVYGQRWPEFPGDISKTVAFTGRFVDREHVFPRSAGLRFAVDTRAGRLHPASIAGLVVGAMGCFICALYVRAWQRERKALARGPGQDMIA